ncbi:hypothetical protein CJ239_05595 [Streptococcus sp. UMB0029]|nr:hypothetical protein CJ239_05595 [Streptococcus sp. UMB0029]
MKISFTYKNLLNFNNSTDSHFIYSMKIKEQIRKLAVGCSKHCFEVVDKTDEVSHIYTARRS